MQMQQKNIQKTITEQKLITRPSTRQSIGTRVSMGEMTEEEINSLINMNVTEDELGTIKIYSGGRPTLGELSGFFQDLRQAYNKLDFFLASDLDEDAVMDALLSDAVPELLPARDLVLIRASLHSPGIWEFLSSLNLLKVICDYIQQRHERKKDNKYRNQAEEERLTLENAILKNQVVKERVVLFKEMGFSDIDVRRLLLSYVNEPLALLDRHVDSMFIQGSEMAVSINDRTSRQKAKVGKKKRV